MHDDEQNIVHDAGNAGAPIMVATTLATLLLAGSAFIWRSNVRSLLAPSGQPHDSPSQRCLDGRRKPSNSHVKISGENSLSVHDEGAAKGSRSKERRRRGKDPLKDLMKGGKRAKAISKLLTLDEAASDLSRSAPGPASEAISHGLRPRDVSLSTSSRSVSSASSSSRDVFGGMSDANAGNYEGSTTSEDPDDYPSTPTVIPLASFDHEEPADSYQHPNAIVVSDITATTASETSDAPTSSQFISATNLPKSSTPASSSRHTPTFPGPWDWDGNSILPPSKADSHGRKSSHLRSKSRNTQASGSSVAALSSIPNPSAIANPDPPPLSESSSVSSSLGEEDDMTPALSFPSHIERTQSSTPSSDTKSPRKTPAEGNSPTPRRAGGTPRRTPTPSSSDGTPPLSLSTQTQIASLRGALEAARLREEKTRAELERCTKDMDMMRWETSVWRRREVELQSQMHHLVHQLQTYATLFMNMSPPGGPGTPQHFQQAPPQQNRTGGSKNASPSPRGYQVPLPSNTQSPPPVGVHVLPNGMLSPMSPHSPFFAFPQQATPPVPPPAQPVNPISNNNLYSLLFPSSVGGTSTNSSSGASSPDSVTNTPSDRGRSRRRTRTANADLGGWVSVSGESDDEEHEDEDEDRVDSVLADAILKRPEAIRLGSSKKRVKEKEREKEKEKEEKTEEPPVEFTFPSLTDFGGGGGGGAGAGEAAVIYES